MHVTFTNPQTGEQKTVKQGFSWVLFLLTEFYGIPLFIRGLHLHGAIVAIIGVVGLLSPRISVLVPLAGLGLMGAMIFYGIKGNELTMAMLERKGWIRTSPGLTPSPMAAASPIADTDIPADDGDKTCPRCAETVKAAAMVCKHCGFAFIGGVAAPAPKSNKLLKGFGIAGAVFVGLAIIGAIVGPPNSNGTAASSIAEEGSSGTLPVSVKALDASAEEVYRDYEANEQAAQLKYGKQPVNIGGAIASIELDAADEPMVSLRAGQMLEEVTLHFGSDFSATAAKLQKGQWFAARCKTISEIMGAPQLEDCTMIPVDE
jgi:hypothetical protein